LCKQNPLLLLGGITSNAEYLVAVFLANHGCSRLGVGCFPFVMLYLSSVFLARGVTGSGGQVYFGLNHDLDLTLKLFGRSRRFDPDGEITIKMKIKSQRPPAKPEA